MRQLANYAIFVIGKLVRVEVHGLRRSHACNQYQAKQDSPATAGGEV